MMTREELMIKNKDASPDLMLYALLVFNKDIYCPYKYSETKQIIFHISEAFH